MNVVGTIVRRLGWRGIVRSQVKFSALNRWHMVGNEGLTWHFPTVYYYLI